VDLTPNITAAEAQRLLNQADRLSRGAHDATRWPYITFILGLGSVTSMGTLAMGLTTGSAFGLAYVGTLAGLFALIVFFAVSIRERSAFSRSRRWTAYMASWTVTYVAAIVVVAWVHGSVLWSGITSALIFIVAIACATREARS